MTQQLDKIKKSHHEDTEKHTLVINKMDQIMAEHKKLSIVAPDNATYFVKLDIRIDVIGQFNKGRKVDQFIVNEKRTIVNTYYVPVVSKPNIQKIYN